MLVFKLYEVLQDLSLKILLFFICLCYDNDRLQLLHD